MTTQFTYGPWHLSEETTRDGLRSRLVHGMPEGLLAIVRVEHQGAFYGDGNAHLIKAAPDLYAALDNALPALRQLATEESRANLAPTGIKRTWAADRLKAAEAALAKARGES